VYYADALYCSGSEISTSASSECNGIATSGWNSGVSNADGIAFCFWRAYDSSSKGYTMYLVDKIAKKTYSYSKTTAINTPEDRVTSIKLAFSLFSDISSANPMDWSSGRVPSNLRPVNLQQRPAHSILSRPPFLTLSFACAEGQRKRPWGPRTGKNVVFLLDSLKYDFRTKFRPTPDFIARSTCVRPWAFRKDFKVEVITLLLIITSDRIYYTKRFLLQRSLGVRVVWLLGAHHMQIRTIFTLQMIPLVAIGKELFEWDLKLWCHLTPIFYSTTYFLYYSSSFLSFNHIVVWSR